MNICYKPIVPLIQIIKTQFKYYEKQFHIEKISRILRVVI